MKISFELLKNGLGTLLGLSCTPLGTLWGGVLGPLGRFGAALGRPSGAQELILGFCKASKRVPKGGKGIQGNFISSKTLQDPPNGPQDPPKSCPRGPQETPKRLPGGCQDVLECLLKMLQHRPGDYSRAAVHALHLFFHEAPWPVLRCLYSSMFAQIMAEVDR